MADPNDAFSTLDDFLLSLADGVAHAQTELSRAGALGPPGRQSVYQLPRVDFELKMNLRVVDDPALSARYRDLRPLRASDKHLMFRPLAAEEAATTLEIAAVVKGAFVAIPANSGLPGPVLATAVDASDRRAPVVRVTARNAAGEPLAGVEVQFNVDREESVELNQAIGGQQLVVAEDTGFERGVVTTDASGVAAAVLKISDKQEPGLLALVIDALERTDTLVYEVTKS
jgi:hypothetical protein